MSSSLQGPLCCLGSAGEPGPTRPRTLTGRGTFLSQCVGKYACSVRTGTNRTGGRRGSPESSVVGKDGVGANASRTSQTAAARDSCLPGPHLRVYEGTRGRTTRAAASPGSTAVSSLSESRERIENTYSSQKKETSPKLLPH